jgi:hypothetical protein
MQMIPDGAKPAEAGKDKNEKGDIVFKRSRVQEKINEAQHW